MNKQSKENEQTVLNTIIYLFQQNEDLELKIENNEKNIEKE